MKVNGKTVLSHGTLVIGPNERGELQLPWGLFALVFKAADVRNIRLTTSPPEITFEGTDTPLGLATTLSVPLSNGQTSTLTIAIYSIGEGSAATRVVHYTVS